MPEEVTVSRYGQELKPQWDKFISDSKNGIFIFFRNYMEYHSDRFIDNSLLFLKGLNIVGVMPANVKSDALFSHGGLTFGGIISSYKVETHLMLAIFDKLIEYCKQTGICKIVYKAIPPIYHKLPAGEDLYALFRYDAKLSRRDVSSTVQMDNRLPFTKGRRWSINKGKTAGLVIEQSNNFKDFMRIEEAVLSKKYKVKPTHTAEEMELLAKRFPENIKLFTAQKENEILAGVIVYESGNVAHTQYISSTDEGKKLHATDSVLSYLIDNYYANKRYFDFGISTENEGRFLNEGLIAQKEAFGARAIVYDTYVLEITHK